MRLRFLPISLLLVTLLFSASSYSDNLKQKVQKGTVITDGAVIYKSSSFDGEIVTYVETGRQVVLSRKIYSASDGFGSFYKIRIEPGVYGYVSDVDVKPQFKPDRTKMQTESTGFELDDEEDWGEDDYRTYDNEPMLLKRWIGIGGSYLNYTETLGSKKFSSYENLYSLKLYGPRTLLKETPTDFEIAFMPKAPEYYLELPGSESVSGFAVVGHWSLLLPLREFENFLIYYGLGVTFNYNNFEIKGPTETLSTEEFRAGLIGQLGLAIHLGKSFHLRAEGRYYYEEEKYLGGSASIMKAF